MCVMCVVLFFFFKQKTAYEMCISDWSSDVCSSDLVIMNRVESGRFPSTICGVVTQRDQFSFVRGGKIPAIATNRKAYRTAMAEIGRASCRERVCQYV